MKNIIALLSFGLLGLMLVINGCGGSGGSGNPSANLASNPGTATFKKYCVTCHGADGKMGLNGAANLAVSTLSKNEAVEVITNGRKMMAPYKSILSADEIDQVANHIMTLRE